MKEPYATLKAISIGGHRGMGCSNNAFAHAQNAAGICLSENTLESFKAALDAGVDSIETDLVATRDHHVVLIHSGDLRHHVAGPLLPAGKIYVSDLELAAIRTLPVGPQKNAAIPTLRELLTLTRDERPKGDLLLNLELKDMQGTACPPRHNPSLPELALREIKEANYPLHGIRFSSFSLQMLAELKRLEPSARTGMLFAHPHEKSEAANARIFSHPDYPETYHDFTPETVERVLLQIPSLEALHPEIRTVTETMVKLAAQRNLAIASWAWHEKSPLDTQDTAFADACRQAIGLCRKYHVPLLIITDYAHEMQTFIYA